MKKILIDVNLMLFNDYVKHYVNPVSYTHLFVQDLFLLLTKETKLFLINEKMHTEDVYKRQVQRFFGRRIPLGSFG